MKQFTAIRHDIKRPDKPDNMYSFYILCFNYEEYIELLEILKKYRWAHTEFNYSIDTLYTINSSIFGQDPFFQTTIGLNYFRLEFYFPEQAEEFSIHLANWIYKISGFQYISFEDFKILYQLEK